MVTQLTPASSLDPHDPTAFLEAMQAHTAAYNALFEEEESLAGWKMAQASAKHALAVREAELITEGLTGKNKEERDAALEIRKAQDKQYAVLRESLQEAESYSLLASATVSRITAEVSNAKARMAFITAWLNAEAARREAL